MPYTICEPCVGTCDTSCVDVCPVDCIHGPISTDGSGQECKQDGFDSAGKQLYIDPETCIDCDACVPECPVEAIFEESLVPDEWKNYIPLNYRFFGQEAPGFPD